MKMKYTLAAMALTSLVSDAALTTIVGYDADPDADLGTAAPNPSTQGWTNLATDQLSTPDNTGWRLDDVSASQNPRNTYSISGADLTNMYNSGWEMNANVRFQSGGGFFGWGTTTGADPGWGLAARERVGIAMSATGSDVTFAQLGTSNAFTVVGALANYVDVRIVGEATTQNFEVFINGESRWTSTISAGSSNSSSDNTMQFASGSTGGTGRQIDYADISLSYGVVPEPSSTALLGIGGLALILRRRK